MNNGENSLVLILKALLKFNIDIDAVDWSGRCETPAGIAGQMRPRKSEAMRRLIAEPRKSEYLQRKSTTKFNIAILKKT
ncbi:hypothetical protein ABEP00_17205 [Heyndrickxia sporothermodurans]|uniref:hypothetical protein n=1 Tax=Heyndrickxia TaxID=2837504 RepID=UPI0030F67EF5